MHNEQFKAKTKDTIDYVSQWVVERQLNFRLETFKFFNRIGGNLFQIFRISIMNIF